MASVVVEEPSQSRELLEERLSLFVRSLGVSNDECVQKATHRFMERLVLEQTDADVPISVADGMTEVMAVLHMWLEELLTHAEDKHSHAHDLLLYRLRAVLDRHPECLLQRDPICEELQPAIAMSQVPILPPESVADMPIQDLTTKPLLPQWLNKSHIISQLSRIWSGVGFHSSSGKRLTR